MRSATFVAPLLASLAVAQPHRHAHQHAKHHEARNEPAVEWVTEYEYTTEVVPVTETIWVSAGYVAPTTESTSTPTSKATVPAQFFQPASKKAPTISTTLSTVVYVAPSPTATSSATPPPTTTTTTSIAPPAAKAIETTPSPQPTTVAAPEPTPVSVYTPPAAPTTTVAPVASSAPSSNSGSGSEVKTGDITYYEAGLGACGWTNDGSTEDVVALSHLLMGTQSNGNPYCGKMVKISLNGKSVTAKVVDKCMGCEIDAVDMSNHAFAQLAEYAVGRTSAKWSFV